MGTEIVVGVDGSPCSLAALSWAAAEAALRGAPLVVVYAAVPAAVATWASSAAVPAAFADLQRDAGEQVLREAKTRVGADIAVTAELVAQGPAAALLERSHGAALVVVGGTGRGAISRAVLGSVSTALLHHAQAPVVVVRESADPGDGPVLLGFDGSEFSHRATGLAFEEAARRSAELVVLHAWWSPGAYDLPGLDWDSVQAQIDENLATQLDPFRARHPDVAVRRVVVKDRPAQHLVEQSEDTQLIIVGSRGHGALAGTLLGSVSSAVVQAAQCPVMVVRE